MDEPLPAIVAAYLTSGFARAGSLIAHWKNRSGEHCVLVQYQTDPEPRFELGVFPEVVGRWSEQVNGATYPLSAVRAAVALGNGLPGATWETPPAALLALLDDTAPRRSPYTTLIALDPDRFEEEFLYLPPTPTADPVRLWEQCRAEATRAEATLQQTEFYFADRDANPIDESQLTPDAQLAAALFRRVVDLDGRAQALLPWWLVAAARSQDASVGLLTPSDCRRVARFTTDLKTVLPPGPDTDRLLAVVEAAARCGGWVVGWEPGT